MSYDVKRETARQIDAFNYYYSLGPERNIDKVAAYCGVNRSLVGRWSSNFEWQKRIQLRILEESNMLKMSAKEATDRAMYKLALTMHEMSNQMNDNVVKNKVDLTNAKDIIALFKTLHSYELLEREASIATEQSSGNIVICDTSYDKYEDDEI